MRNVYLVMVGAVIMSLNALATILVSDGFPYDPMDPTAYTKSGIQGQKPSQPFGFKASDAWADTSIPKVGDAGLSFPDCFAEAGLAPLGNGAAYCNSSGKKVTTQRATKRLTDFTMPQSGYLYMRVLINISAKAFAAMSDQARAGMGIVNASHSYNKSAWTGSLDDVGIWGAFRNDNGKLAVIMRVGGSDTVLVAEAACDTTYVVIARIAIETGSVSAYAAPVDSYDPTFEFVAAGQTGTYGVSTMRSVAYAAPYGLDSSKVSFDEFMLATDVTDVCVKRTKGAPRLSGLSVAVNGAQTGFDISATERDNTATEVAAALVDDAGGETKVTLGTDVAAETTVDGTLTPAAADTTYAVEFTAVNAVETWRGAGSSVYSGVPVLAKVSDALVYGTVPATVTVSRASASVYPLTVRYAFSSEDAEAGVDYEIPSGVVEIPCGAASAVIEVKPTAAPMVEKHVTVSLSAGMYFTQGAEAVSVKLKPTELPEEYNVWIGVSGDQLASDAANWSKGVPTSDQDILVDGNYGPANMIWDAGVNGLPATVKSWTQPVGYTGTVTFPTQYPDASGASFTCFTVTGATDLQGGTWTHPLSFDETKVEAMTLERLRANRVYRLNVAARSLTVGAAAAIDASGKGHTRANCGLKATALSATYAGQSKYSSMPAFGSVREPADIGMGGAVYNDGSKANAYAAGGGAVRLVVTETLTVDGAIRANGLASPVAGSSGTGGSVWVSAGSVVGSGEIAAESPSCSLLGADGRAGSGGRVAVHSTTAVDFSTLTLSASAYGQACGGISGTVFVKDSTLPNGELRIVNRFSAAGGPVCWDWVTPFDESGTATFDRVVLGGNVALRVRTGETLNLPNGLASVSSVGATSSGRPALVQEGGALNLGSAKTQTVSGNWIFGSISNYVLTADLLVTSGAALGLPATYSHQDKDAPPETTPAFRLTVNGNVDVAVDGALTADRCGATYDSGFGTLALSAAAHGGRSTSDAFASDSVINPFLPGCDTYSRHPQDGSEYMRYSGGLFCLTVTGTLNMDGTASASSFSATASTEAPGSFNLRVGRLTGKGTIRAELVGSTSGGGGRVAVRLTEPGATFDGFAGSLRAAAHGSSGSAGTVYLQAADDAEGAGRIIVNNANSASTVTTPIPANGYGADETKALRKATVALSGKARVSLPRAKLRLAGLEIAPGSMVDLSGHALCCDAMMTNGVPLECGVYTADQLPDVLMDSIGAGGTVTVGRRGLGVFVR